MKGAIIVLNYKIKNQADSTADIFIDGDIVDAPTQEILKSWFGDDTSTSYKSFRDAVDGLDAKTLNVYINSGGGQVTEAMAIHDLLIDLQEKGKTVNTIGRGIIASAATYILMAGKNPKMSSNSWLMIHNVSGAIYGNVNEIENYAVTMRKFNDAANEFYQKSTGLSKTVIGNMMDQETWMTAEEAKTKGFIKEVAGEASFTQKIRPEQWPFANSAVLNSYNSYLKKTPKNMSDAEMNYLRQLIPLQQKEIDLSKAILQNTTDPFVQSLAGGIIEDETDNIEEIQEQLNGTSEPESRHKKNSFNNKTSIMDAQKITEAINNGFTSLLEKLGISNKKDDAETKKAFEDFSNSITNAITENAKDGLDEEGVKKIVNQAVTDALKELPENFTKAITDSQKDFLKKEDIKDVLNKEDFKKEMDTLREDIGNTIAKGSKTIGNKDGKEKNKAENKYAYENLWPSEN